jgi:hypothetical protein
MPIVIGVLEKMSRRELRKGFSLLALALALHGSAWAQSSAADSIFYAIGEPAGTQHRDVRLYEVNARTLEAVRSISVQRILSDGEIDAMSTGMLTGKGDAILLTDAELGNSTLMRVAAPALTEENQIGMSKLGVHGVNCLDHLFVHPITSLAYFSCDSGNHGNGFVIVDSTKRLVVGSFPQGPVLPKDWPRLRILDPRFVYDRASKDLFLVGEDAVALDKENHPLSFVSGTEVAKAAGFDMTPVHVPGIQETLPPRYSLEGLVVVPDHKLVLLLKNGKTPTLVLWDRNNKTALATWKETQTYINTDTRTLRPGEKSRQDPLSCGEPLVSRDGSKLFVESKGGEKTGLLIFEAGTLKLLRRLALPESSGPEGMLRAPDSRGIWYVGESGKVYRLDENTGDVVEQVKLPFHLLSVIREP